MRRLLLPVGLPLLVVALLGYWLWTLQRNWGFVSAAEQGNVAQVRAGLDSGINADVYSHIGGMTALRMAIFGGHPDVVQLLLDRGANPTGGLSQAISKGRPDLVKMLIDKGAAVSIHYKAGGSPLRQAKGTKNHDVIRLLKSAGARE